MAKNKKDKQITAHMTQHRKLKNKQHEPHKKTRGDVRCSGRVSRSCSTCSTRRVAYVITNPISFAKRLFHNGQPTRDGVRKIYDDFNFTIWNFWFDSFLVSSNSPDRKKS